MEYNHKITTLARSISLIVVSSICMPAYALQPLDDSSLTEVTGEGIAFTLNDFSMQFNGANDNAGIGYTRIIPVGPLSSTIDTYNTNNPTTKIGKADLWLYGLSISGNDGDSTKQFSGNTVNIGTADNPWLISVNTVTTPNFAGVDSSLSILNIEAPLLTNLLTSDGTLLGTDPNSYDLKLGTWADAFVRDLSKTENLTATDNQFGLNSIDANGNRYVNGASGATTLRENRLRLQAIMNGVSLNGTNLKLFQTLDGAETATGLGSAYSSYNNTLGLAATARINSGAATSARAPTFTVGATTSDVITPVNGAVSAWTLLHGGWETSLSPSQSGTSSCGNNGSVTDSPSFNQTGCQYMVRSRTRTDSKTRVVTKNITWANSGLINNKVIRLSTQEKGTTQGLLSTPAINGGTMPTFADTEGLFLYNPNINLVLGTQWQPLIFGVNGNNLVIELTRIPNQENVYKQIYTDYTGADAAYKGGTCSVYWCGGAGNGNSVNATHSSITIGSTVYTAPVNTGTNKTPLLVTAYKGADAIGVSFGDLAAAQGTTTTGTATNITYATTTQADYVKRMNNSDKTWRYYCDTPAVTFTCGLGGNNATGTLNQWQYGATVVNEIVTQDASAGTNYPSSSTNYDYPVANGTGYTWRHNQTAAGLCGADTDCTYYSATNNRNWVYNPATGQVNIGSTTLPFVTTTDNNLDTWLGTQGSTARTTNILSGTSALANQAATTTVPTNFVPLNAVNLGSAVIDGVLIQHMKITTKGL
ncbi:MULTISPECIES: hypothetical protein [Acinetobacter]|uniref:hypothetical protein n=1 Tax=Acinetobacter TaxID=469 RepID=UPI00257C939D|nr:hypothetical protein [Acinetobacter sp. UBA2063]